jgi:hypothetical protein
MNASDKEFSVTFDEAQARVTFAGLLRLRSPKEYDEIKRLLRDAHALFLPTLILDFRGLEFLNSSGISTIGQFVVEVRKANRTKLVLHATAAHPWQARSLGTIQRIWSEVQLVIDN